MFFLQDPACKHPRAGLLARHGALSTFRSQDAIGASGGGVGSSPLAGVGKGMGKGGFWSMGLDGDTESGKWGSGGDWVIGFSNSSAMIRKRILKWSSSPEGRF